MGKIKVTNGNEQYEIEVADLKSAMADGFRKVEQIPVTNGKEVLYIDDTDLDNAMKDGYVKKKAESNPSPTPSGNGLSPTPKDKKSSLSGCVYSALVTKDLGILTQQILQKYPKHPLTLRYFEELKNVQELITILTPSPDLLNLIDPKIGIMTEFSDIVWRMSSFVYKYPSVCEHVPFHASMIVNGHDKLFINPRLIFRYGS